MTTRIHTRHATCDAEPLHVNRNLLIAGALLVACTAAWWTLRAGPGEASVVRDTSAALPLVPGQLPRSADEPVRVPPPEPGTEPTEAELQFQRYVDDKYRLLFRDLEGDAASALRAALSERERVVVQVNTAKQTGDVALRATLPALLAHLAELDRQVGTVLPARELGAFAALKDADIERFQVEDYAAGIQNVAPLADTDKQAILTTKLAYRERFRRVLAESRLMTADLGATERRLAFDAVSRALKDYQQSYLQEVRQYLYDDEQYALLTNYENTEYTGELARLRSIAGLE
jgi:hypothetical protein